jgi:endonuclease/exonuclease/phosphatase family metal-dependent hydrolase
VPQEVWQSGTDPNTAGWIVEHLSGDGWSWAFGGAPFAESLWPDASLLFGSAVLSRWPIEHTLHLLPVASDEDPFVAGVPWELLHARTAGLDVFSTHLVAPPTGGVHRLLQVVALDELVRAAREGLDVLPAHGRKRVGMPAIVCGDFNAEPDSDEIRFLTSLHAVDGRTAFYQDAWRVAGQGPGLTQDWRTNDIAAAMNLHRKRIDYVFVGDPFQRAGRRAGGSTRSWRSTSPHRDGGERPQRPRGRRRLARPPARLSVRDARRPVSRPCATPRRCSCSRR